MPFCPFMTLRAKLVPRIQPCDASRVWALPCDFEDVPEAVVVETAHGGEVGGEAFAVPCLKLLDKQLHVGGDDFFRGLGLGGGGKGGDVAGGGVGGGCVLGGVAGLVAAHGVKAPGFESFGRGCFTLTPWPRPTPAGAASARAGFLSRRAGVLCPVCTSAARKIKVALVARQGRSPSEGLVSLLLARFASRRNRFVSGASSDTPGMAETELAPPSASYQGFVEIRSSRTYSAEVRTILMLLVLCFTGHTVAAQQPCLTLSSEPTTKQQTAPGFGAHASTNAARARNNRLLTCRDGSLSFAHSRSGQCSYHGGIRR